MNERSAENGTTLEETKLVWDHITNKRLYAEFILIIKSCGKNISEKYSMVELKKVIFNYRKHDKPNHALFADI
jgi:hypothetical protein